jgi:hypothetical protein
LGYHFLDFLDFLDCLDYLVYHFLDFLDCLVYHFLDFLDCLVYHYLDCRYINRMNPTTRNEHLSTLTDRLFKPKVDTKSRE